VVYVSLSVMVKMFRDVRMDPVNIPAKFEVPIALAVPEIIAIAVLGWGCEPQFLGKGRP